MSFEKSSQLFDEAKQCMPGGVNSPARAFGGVGGTPVFIERGSGARMYSADGDEYIDYVLSWGPLILGHTHPQVVAGLKETLEAGTSFGAPTALETELAELIINMVPSVEKIRMVNSGTEATMSAIRVARGYTKRNRVLKFEGCYHGHGDSFLIKAGSGALTLGIPNSPGITEGTAADTIVAQYNDLDSVKAALAGREEEFAAIIVEPVAGNMGCVPPAPGFLEGLRQLTAAYGIVLIFDEVMTGFRVAPDGAQGLYGIRPDLTTMGKVVGGGLPVGAYGGREDIMGVVAPDGAVYQAGTLSGNPLAMRGGIETLKQLQNPELYWRLDRMGKRLEEGMLKNCETTGVKGSVNRVGSMLTFFFNADSVQNFAGASACDLDAFTKYFHGMLERGIYLPPSQFEAMFLSSAHTEEDIDKTIAAHLDTLSAL
jgi:glutamate-1-semialdehyde 2,1-aminomutase